MTLAAREVATWARLGSEHYIAVFSRDCSWNSESKHIRLYMDYYEGEDVQQAVDRCRFDGVTIHPLVVAIWGFEIASGVQTCHSNDIIHRDLKPAKGVFRIFIRLKIPFDMPLPGNVVADS